MTAQQLLVEPAGQGPANRRRPASRPWTQSLADVVMGRRGVTALVVLIVAVLSLVPAIYLVIGAFSVDGAFTWSGFREAYVENDHLGWLLANSFEFACGATLVSLALGSALAFLQTRTDVPFKPLIFASSVMPLLVPPLQYATGWMILAGPGNGVLTNLPGLGGLNVYGMGGMIVVQGLLSTPLAFLMVSSALVGMDPSLEESARASGASWPEVFRKVTLPLLRQAMLGAALLMFVQMIDSFEIPAILGLRSRTYVFTSQIYFSLQQGGNPAEAGAIGLGLLVIAITALLLSRLATRRGSTATITGKAFRPRLVPLRGARWIAGAFVIVYTVIAFVLPLLALVYTALLPYYQAPSSAAFHAMSLHNFTALKDLDGLDSSLRNSLVVAAVSATGVSIITLISSWLMARWMGPRLQRVMDSLLFMPIVMPGIILGLAVSYIFLRISIVPVYGTLWIFVVAFLSRYLPWGSRFSNAAVTQVSVELEEAGLVSGASRLDVFRRVLLPLVFSSIVAGWLYIFVLAFREVSAAILLYSPDTQVVSVLMWQMANSGDLPSLAALGVLLIAVLSIVTFLVRKLGGGVGMTSR